MARATLLLLLTAQLLPLSSRGNVRRPNFIIIFADDQGYGDLGCFDSKTIKTPNIDRLAREGRRFTNFMVASPVCTPSRAALLTGCYPKRVGLHKGVLFPNSTHGLNPDEHTIADQLKGVGYATACIGKWHLGHHKETLPRKNGFDSYFGIPYSNDMNHPDNQGKPEGGWKGMDMLWQNPNSALKKWKTPLVKDETIVECPVDQRMITTRYTDKAIEFVKKKKDKPFFLYLAHSMPHIPLYVPDSVRDPDVKNAYVCTIQHLDEQVGRLIDTVRELGLEKDTYVIYTSDNGPWLKFKHHGGSAGPLRAGKGTTYEGGQRVPCVVWGPGRVPAGTVCDGLSSTMDLLPTIAKLAGTELPQDLKIDGIDISSAFLDSDVPVLRESFLYYSAGGKLEGIRKGQWKLIRKTPRGKAKEAARPADVELYNLQDDIGEEHNVAKEQPKIVETLLKEMQTLDREITANARKPWQKK